MNFLKQLKDTQEHVDHLKSLNEGILDDLMADETPAVDAPNVGEVWYWNRADHNVIIVSVKSSLNKVYYQFYRTDTGSANSKILSSDINDFVSNAEKVK